MGGLDPFPVDAFSESQMALRLTLLCHASTTALRRAAFPLDEPLDAKGERQAALLADRLAPADRCWTSPALRARQTAAALRLAATIEPALGDCDFGRWAGRTLDDVARSEPDATAAWLGDPAAAPHGGESLLALLRRVASWLDGQAGGRGHALAVTHAAVVRAAILHAIGAPAQSFWHIDIGPLTRTDIRCGGGRWTLRSIDGDHA
jgi:broad specificity phosphatase PhoE